VNATHSHAPQLSVVIPANNEGGNIAPLIAEVESALSGRLEFEVIVVNDGSSDGTAQEVNAFMESRNWLRLENHDRKRGQSAGIVTGVRVAQGPLVALLDGDGQNDPADIPTLLAKLEASGAAMVIGERRIRQDSWVRRLSSRVGNSVRAALLHDGVRDTGSGLKLVRRADFLALPQFDHMHRFLPALIKQQGGEVLSIPVNHRPRRHGTSKYGIHDRLWTGVIDLLGVKWLERRRI
jgi:dolichol-phosphate mannosyltransferase